MYYGLTNYYQNHRRYVKSRDDDQLLGKLNIPPSSDCLPFAEGTDGKPVAPCGAIANSLFSDTFDLVWTDQSNMNVPLLRTDIAWPSDKKYKFNNPPGVLKDALINFTKPDMWDKYLWELDPEIEENNGFQVR